MSDLYHIEQIVQKELCKTMENVLSDFEDVYQLLTANNHTKNNQYNYFDDYDAYVIPCKEEGKRAMVIGSWFKYGGTKFVIVANQTSFIGRYSLDFTVQRMVKGDKKGAGNSLKAASINTLIKNNFEYRKIGMYGDCRDETHVLKYYKHVNNGEVLIDEFGSNVLPNIMDISSFVGELNHCLCNLEEYKD